MRRRSSFTLLEVIISLGLITLLVSTLFFSMSDLSKREKALEAQVAPLQMERYADERLCTLFENVHLAPCFFTSEGDLILMYDRGPHPDPLLSGIVLARLHFAQKTLSLTLWPKPGETPLLTPKEDFVLLTNIETLKFSFYSPPNPFKMAVDPREVGKSLPLDGWQNVWLKDYNALPALVKITLKINEHEFDLLYDLPGQLVTYRYEGALS